MYLTQWRDSSCFRSSWSQISKWLTFIYHKIVISNIVHNVVFYLYNMQKCEFKLDLQGKIKVMPSLNHVDQTRCSEQSAKTLGNRTGISISLWNWRIFATVQMSEFIYDRPQFRDVRKLWFHTRLDGLESPMDGKNTESKKSKDIYRFQNFRHYRMKKIHARSSASF